MKFTAGAKEFRERLGLTIEEAAAAMGLSPKRLELFERDKLKDGEQPWEFCRRNEHITRRYHDAFGMDLFVFILGSNHRSSSAPSPLRSAVDKLAEHCRACVEAFFDEREQPPSGERAKGR